MNRRMILFALMIAAAMTGSGCFLAPELAIEFDWYSDTPLPAPSVTINYWIRNVSGTDLDNCKLEFEITTDEPDTYKVWTWGHSIAVWDDTGWEDLTWTAPNGYFVTDVQLIGAGMDDPGDE